MPDDPPLVSAKWPHVEAELVTALREEGQNDLADRVDTLHLLHPLQQCGCDDDFCQSFFAAPEPTGAYGPGDRNVGLSPSKPGYLILDVVDDTIMYVEVLHRPPLT
jgi:hypothetical protein